MEKSTFLKDHIRSEVTSFILFCFCALLFVPMSFAQTRQHGAHVHGVGTLNMAVTDQGIYLELESPAMNVLGFGHAPNNAEQEQAVADVKKQLRDGQSLFVLPPAAQCQLTEVKVEQKALAKKDEEHEHADEHAHHEHHDHDQHNDADQEQHHDDTGEGHSGHSEFHGLYQFTCAAPEKLTSVDVQLFSLFPGFERLDVQLLTPKGQAARELTAKEHQINW